MTHIVYLQDFGCGRYIWVLLVEKSYCYQCAGFVIACNGNHDHRAFVFGVGRVPSENAAERTAIPFFEFSVGFAEISFYQFGGDGVAVSVGFLQFCQIKDAGEDLVVGERLLWRHDFVWRGDAAGGCGGAGAA